MLVGEFKQELLKVNNNVNIEVFHQGLHHQRVEIVGDKVIIIARNNRVKVLSVLDKCDPMMARMADIALLAEFKRNFIKTVETHFGVPILSFIKDYDPKLEMSVSVTFYHKPIDELLPLMNLRPIEPPLTEKMG
jgi:hypothetical protein